MSPVADAGAPIVGINWGSSNFRAYLIAADGTLTSERCEAGGVVGASREDMVALVEAVARSWPTAGSIYASGMIGSNVGWVEVPYAEAPARADDLIARAVATTFGSVAVTVVPGVACVRASDGQPDVMRGEEVELLGLAALGSTDGLAVLPGTHTKWVQRADGGVGEFLTCMSGEIFDRLTAHGLLASVIAGEATVGPAFEAGVHAGMERRTGLSAALFGVRAQVIRGVLMKGDAASYLRGLLIGAELADIRRFWSGWTDALVPLIGNAALSRLYAAALAMAGAPAVEVSSREACVAGFATLHRAARG